jgi:hypothetical protein
MPLVSVSLNCRHLLFERRKRALLKTEASGMPGYTLAFLELEDQSKGTSEEKD